MIIRPFSTDNRAQESMIRDYQAIHQTWFERGKQRVVFRDDLKIYQMLQSLAKSTKFNPDDGSKPESSFGKDCIQLYMDGPDGFHEHIIYRQVSVLDVAFSQVPYDSSEKLFQEVVDLLFPEK